MAFRLRNHYLCFPWQWSKERDGDSFEPNDKTGYRNGRMSSFQTSPSSSCSIPMAVYLSRVSEEKYTSAACIRYQHRGLSPGVMVSVTTGYTTHTSLLRIDSNLNADGYSSDILRPVVVLYLRGLPNAIFLQDNARQHIPRYIRYSIVALTCTVSGSVTHWKHLVMDCSEADPPPLSN